MKHRKEIIGDCELYLGDCLDIMPLIGKVDAVVTDPPFGMGFVSSRRNEETKHKNIANDKDSSMLLWATNIEANHSSYIFCRWDNLYEVKKPRSFINWVKNNHSMGDLEHEHGRITEGILFYPHKNHKWPNRRPTDIIYADKTGNELHPTQKPVSLMKNIIDLTLGIIFDPFMGSGTTGVACAQKRRKFTGIEIDQEYFDIACKRVEQAYKQPDLFIEETKKAEQIGMEL